MGERTYAVCMSFGIGRSGSTVGVDEMELLPESTERATLGFETATCWRLGGVCLREGIGLDETAFRAGIRTLAGSVETGRGS